MTRFAWLQSRTQTLGVYAMLGALAIAAAITGVHLSNLYHSHILHCTIGCDLATTEFLHSDTFLRNSFDVLSLVTPALLGIFWGAPLLAREFEAGTYRLAWTQSVTRSRWLTTKLATGAGAVATIAGILTLVITWWYRALDKVGSNPYDLFERRDIAPIGYAVFAFAAGALIGVVIQRVVPTMAATLGVYVGARIVTTRLIRPHLLPPLHKTLSMLNADGFGFVSSDGSPITLVAKASAGSNTWTQSTQILTSTGHVASSAQLTAFVQQYCPAIANPPAPGAPGNGPVKAAPGVADAFHACRDEAARVFHLAVTYQPASRYWALQWLETGIFVALAALAIGGCYWWIARRAR